MELRGIGRPERAVLAGESGKASGRGHWSEA